jgi:hypothetical protein
MVCYKREVISAVGSTHRAACCVASFPVDADRLLQQLAPRLQPALTNLRLLQLRRQLLYLSLLILVQCL